MVFTGRQNLQLPATVEDLEAAIHDTMSQANSILFHNPNVLEQYESRQVKVCVLVHYLFLSTLCAWSNFVQVLQIDDLTRKLDEDENKLNKLLDEINSLKVVFNGLPFVSYIIFLTYSICGGVMHRLYTANFSICNMLSCLVKFEFCVVSAGKLASNIEEPCVSNKPDFQS